MTKTLTLRLPKAQAAELEEFARFDGVAVADEIREAITLLVQAKQNDPQFRSKVQASLLRSQEMLRKLGEKEIADALTSERGRRHKG